MRVYILFDEDELIEVFESLDDAIAWPFVHAEIQRPYEYDRLSPAFENEWRRDDLGTAEYLLWPRKRSKMFRIYERTVQPALTPTSATPAARGPSPADHG